MAANVFSVSVFLVVFRETIEAAIVVAVLLAFIKKTLGGSEETSKGYKSALKQVWIGAALGLLLCLIIGGAIIGTFYRLGTNLWDKTEYYYEGVFYLIAALIITVVGAAMLRVGKMQEKWQVKLNKVLQEPVNTNSRMSWLKTFSGKYGIFVLCFFTVAREGIEGIPSGPGTIYNFVFCGKSMPITLSLAWNTQPDENRTMGT
ncbi:hypothetical protein VTK73DRAFT_4258 [Phialemonium thermophilum]|uniref:Plasma membrane iron permease n=1 Tax=Phialemonium thermophilum TaxID=223376 RepID=A0ABR3VA55_9PEZI